MKLQQIKICRFRNLNEIEINFKSRFTILYGQNGAGKTNILEALYLLSTLRSFRCSELTPLIHYDQEEAAITALGFDQDLSLPSRLNIQLKKNKRSVRKTTRANGKLVRSGSDFYGRFPTILFTPEDLGILRGSPGERRKFFDRMLFARSRAHISDVREYEKLLRSRNFILRNQATLSPSVESLLSTFETKLAEVAARIWTRREQIIQTIKNDFVQTFAQIQGMHMPAEIMYQSQLGKAEESRRKNRLLEELRTKRSQDFLRGTTTVGPHRDDFLVTLNHQQASTFASQGQLRSLVLALKIAELKSAKTCTGKAPILLLDDVSSELDPQRTEQLFITLSQVVDQCILTTTAAHFIQFLPTPECQYLSIQNGSIIPEKTTI